jgi:hypothetical protein
LPDAQSAGDPAYSETLKTMREQLDTYLRSTADPRSFGLNPWQHFPDYYLNPDGKVPYPWPGRETQRVPRAPWHTR